MRENELNYDELGRKMQAVGSTKHVVTIRNWIQPYSHTVGPMDAESYEHIAILTQEKYEKEINFIANVLTDRSKDIASRLNSHMIDDSEEIRQEVLNVFDTWDARAEEFKDIPFAYGNKYMVKGPGEAEGRLMKVFNTSPKDNKPFDTMTSMRNVDSSVAANIIVWE